MFQPFWVPSDAYDEDPKGLKHVMLLKVLRVLKVLKVLVKK